MDITNIFDNFEIGIFLHFGRELILCIQTVLRLAIILNAVKFMILDSENSSWSLQYFSAAVVKLLPLQGKKS